MILWYNEKAWTFLIVGTIACTLFTLFSVAACVIPMYMKFMKFLNKKAEHQSLPADADEATLRKSLFKLQEVAAEVHQPVNVEDLRGLFKNSDGDEISVRQSMPPMSALRRSANMLLSSSEKRVAMNRMASFKVVRKEKEN